MFARLSITFAALLLVAAAPPPDSYSEDDFSRVRKFDAHVHANVDDTTFISAATAANFELLSINVDYPDFPALAMQAAIATRLHRAEPRRFHFTTTFSMNGFGTSNWQAGAERMLADGFAAGAIGVKVWKNIGMVAEDTAGQRVFIDDPRLNGVMAAIEARGVPLIAHQGEPKNCWLPLDQMTTANDRAYFAAHPEYYMYLHPEEPSYEALMAARDRFVSRHPRLSVVGAHMASLEWSVDELASFLDRYPNATVDLAARMSNIQAQSVQDRDRVRDFFMRYQDRVLYGTDLTHSQPDPAARAQNPPATDNFAAEADRVWRSDWRYLATGLSQRVDAIEADAAGLELPRAVIDKIYFANARRVFRLEQTVTASR